MTDTNRIPEFPEIINNAIDSKLLNTHVALPGIVESYDKAKQKANILPAIKRKFIDSDPFDLPIITDVPVVWQSANAGQAFITLPLKKGDTGLLIICERSITDWLSGTGETVLPYSKRKHDLTDSVFIPGVLPFKNALSGLSDDNIHIKNSDLEIVVDPGGKISISNTANELLAIIEELITDLENALVVTALGASPFTTTTIAAFTAVKTKLQTMKI